MSENKFTKGPWLVMKSCRADYISVQNQDMDEIHAIGINESDAEVKTANAHLIATAPEMYKMLASLLRHEIESVDTHNRVVDLLAKARGQQ